MQTWFEIVHSVRGFMSSLNDLRTKFCNTYVVDYQNLVRISWSMSQQNKKSGFDDQVGNMFKSLV